METGSQTAKVSSNTLVRIKLGIKPATPGLQGEHTTDKTGSSPIKQFFINVSYKILVASLTLMALFKTEPSELD